MTKLKIAVLLLLTLASTVEATEPWRLKTPNTLFDWFSRPQPGGELGPIVTDRPDFTEASSTVGFGVAQLETGYTFTTNTDNGSTTNDHSWGEPLIRVGVLANWLEFRTAIFPKTQYARTNGVPTTNQGLEDLYLGAKIGLTPQAGFLPETAIIPQMTVPTGARVFSSNRVLPGVNYVYSWELNEKCSFAGSTQYNANVDGIGNVYSEWAQSATIGRSLTETVAAYAEWYAIMPDRGVNVGTQHVLNGGFTHSPDDDIQFDLRFGLGLNEAADDFFVGSGVSIRYGHHRR